MPMPQYNGPMYSQGPTAVGPYNLQGYQSTFGYNPQQTYLPQTQQPQMADCCCSIQRAIDGVNYNNAQNFCNLGNTMQSVGYYGCQQNGYQSCGC